MKTLLTLLFATLAITSVRADVQSDLAAFGQVLNDVNKGFMAALTEDPDSLSTDCVERSEASGVEIEKLFDTTTYYDDQFSIGALLNSGNSYKDGITQSAQRKPRNRQTLNQDPPRSNRHQRMMSAQASKAVRPKSRDISYQSDYKNQQEVHDRIVS